MKLHPAPSASCLLLAFTCLLLNTQGAFAQEQEQMRTVTFSTYLWSEPEGRVLTTTPQLGENGEMRSGAYLPLQMGFINKAGGLEKFDMTARAFSAPQEYRGLNPLVFAVERPGSTADTPSYRKVGQVVLPENVNEALLFFFPQGDAASGHYNISLMPSGPDDIPAGQALVVNLSGAPIAVKLGNQQVALQPEGMQKVTVSGLERNRLPMMMAAQEKDRWQLKLERNISMVSNTALLILFHQDNGSYRIENIRLQR